MDLTGLKVKIGLEGKHHKFPPFNDLPIVQDSGIDWAYWVDMHGMGWCYDKVTGHKDHTTESPFGEWHGCLLVPQQFVTEALAEFPSVCSAMTEVEYQDFYDNKAMVRLPENTYDEQAVASIDREVVHLQELSDAEAGNQSKKDAVTAAKAKRSKALDPDDDTPGMRKNHKRYWVDHKAKSGVTYV